MKLLAISESIAILNRSAEALESQVTETIAQMPRRSAHAGGTRRPPPRARPVSAKHGAADRG